MSRRILLVEDEAETRDYIAQGLGESGFAVEATGLGRDALHLARSGCFDAIVLDRMLPDTDGTAILRTLRLGGDRTPVILLTAMTTTDDRVRGLRAGADDYLAKPFAFSELAARLEAVMRRAAADLSPDAGPETELLCGDLLLDLDRREARRGPRRIALSQREFQLLEHLMRRQGAVVTRTMVLENLWDFHFDPSTNVIDGHVARLRRKIDAPGEPSMIQTIRGAGYRIAAAQPEPSRDAP